MVAEPRGFAPQPAARTPRKPSGTHPSQPRSSGKIICFESRPNNCLMGFLGSFRDRLAARIGLIGDDGAVIDIEADRWREGQ